jgi:pimeloyl-ACP methyl ester carboxylesterase
MLTGEEKFVRSGDLRLWTERFGEPSAPAVLLIMGTAAQGIGWPDELVARLVEAGHQVLRFDHRDTGRSDCVDFATQPYALADLAADSVAVLEGHGILTAHVAGASLGGAIGQWLAVHRPERVRKLTAIMTSPMGNNPGPAWARAFAGQPPLRDELPPPSPRFLRHLVMPRTEADPVEAGLQTLRILNGEGRPFDEAAARRYTELAHQRAEHPEAAHQHDLAGRRWDDDRIAPLSAITAPTLIVHGSDDPLFPPAHAEALAAEIPGSHLHIVPGMGHGLFSPALPTRVADLILET